MTMRNFPRMPMPRVALITAAILAVTSAHLLAQTPAPSGPQEVRVVGVFVDPSGTQPVVVLQGKKDKRTFAIRIGPAEYTGIAFPLENRVPPRPLTHDLFLTLFGRLKVTVTRVIVTDLKDGIYYATLVLDASGREIQLDSRPSDAIALAVRAKAPVLVEDRVFEKSELLPTQPSGPRI